MYIFIIFWIIYHIRLIHILVGIKSSWKFLKRWQHQARHLNGIFNNKISILSNSLTFINLRIYLILNFGNSYCNKFILSPLRLNLLLFIFPFSLQIIYITINPINLIIMLLLQLQQTGKLILIPSQLLLHLNNPIIIIKLILLLLCLIFQHLQLLLDLTHMSSISTHKIFLMPADNP